MNIALKFYICIGMTARATFRDQKLTFVDSQLERDSLALSNVYFKKLFFKEVM